MYPIDKVPVPTRLDFDVEDPADDAEDPRDGLEALVDVGEAHEVLESLMKTMMPLQRSWSPLIWWHDGTLMKSLMLKILVLALDPLVSFVEKVMEPLTLACIMMVMTLYGLWHVVDALALKKKP